MQRDAIEQMTDALRTLFGNLQRYSSYQTVHFVSERQQVFSQIAAVLSSDSSDEGFFTHFNLGKESESFYLDCGGLTPLFCAGRP